MATECVDLHVSSDFAQHIYMYIYIDIDILKKYVSIFRAIPIHDNKSQ